jgi:O-antigen/teichoic acid export membrane protein
LFASFFILVFGKFIILFLWGKEFNEMYEPLLLTLPGVICFAVSYLFSPIFAGLGKVRYNLNIGLLTLAVVVICNFLLVPSWGIRGAAISTSVGFVVMMISYFIIAKQKFGFSFKNKNFEIGK